MIIFKTTEPNPYKPNVYYKVSISTEDIIIYSMTTNVGLVLDVSFIITLTLWRSRTGTVWFYTSTSNKRVARPKLYTKSLTWDLKRMYSRLTLVRISINL